MNTKRVLIASASVLIFSALCLGRHSNAEAPPERVVRLAELDIDPVQLEAYKDALREEINASIRIEPGVLALNAVALRDDPTQIRIFEVYADTSAYKAHLETAHFKKYKTITHGMIKSLKLMETQPIALGTKDR